MLLFTDKQTSPLVRIIEWAELENRVSPNTKKELVIHKSDSEVQLIDLVIRSECMKEVRNISKEQPFVVKILT